MLGGGGDQNEGEIWEEGAGEVDLGSIVGNLEEYESFVGLH